MGTGQSKNSPDEQMRMKMENGFDDDEDDEVEALSPVERPGRSKSNISFHTSDRQQNPEDEEYFNKIYNKRAEKSLSSLNNGSISSIGVKSAPPGPKKEKDPEVAAAIAELEETFKNLGDNALKSEDVIVISPPVPLVREEGFLREHDDDVPDKDVDSPPSLRRAESSTRETSHSEESGMDSPSVSPPCQIQYDRHLITRAGETRDGCLRRPELTSSRVITTCSGSQNNAMYISSGSSRGSESRGMLISQTGLKPIRHSSTPQSILMQQRKDFQRKFVPDRKPPAEAEDVKPIRAEDWNYEPPKIDGFDVNKFKEINSKKTNSTIVPIIMRDDDDKGYYSRTPEIPAYTKDELELIATLEREVY